MFYKLVISSYQGNQQEELALPKGEVNLLISLWWEVGIQGGEAPSLPQTLGDEALFSLMFTFQGVGSQVILWW